MSTTDAPKKRGRPRKSPEGTRIKQTIRIKPSILARLKSSAAESSRTVSDEMEFRVNQSFEAIAVDLSEPLMSAIEAVAEAEGRTPAQEIERLVERGIIASKKIAEMSAQELASFIKGTMLNSMQVALARNFEDNLRQGAFKHLDNYGEVDELNKLNHVDFLMRMVASTIEDQVRRRPDFSHAEDRYLDLDLDPQTKRVDALVALETEMAALLERPDPHRPDLTVSQVLNKEEHASLEATLERKILPTEQYRDIKKELAPILERQVKEGQAEWREHKAEHRKTKRVSNAGKRNAKGSVA